MRPLPALLLLSLPLLAAAQSPPPTPQRPVIDDYFGTKITDPYRYLENLADPEVQTWFKAQADYAAHTLAALPDRDQLAKDIVKYVNATPAAVSAVTRTFDNAYFIQKTLPGQNTGKLYFRQSLTAPESLLVDPDHFAGPHGEPAAINYFTPSCNGRYVAVGISVGGSEDSVIHIVDVATGKPLPETIDRAEYGNIQWQPDDHAFAYTRLQKLTPTSPKIDKYMNPATFLHVLNTDPETDRKLVEKGLSTRVPMTSVDGPAVLFQPDSHYALCVIQHGVQGEQTIFSTPLSSLDQSDIPWTKLCDVEDQITDFALHGDDLFLLSHKDASHFKILQLHLPAPDLAHAAAFLPPGDAILHNLAAAADALYVRELLNGSSHILRVPYDGATHTDLPLPFPGNASFQPSDPRQPGILFSLASWTRGNRICEYNPATNAVTTTDIAPAGPFDNRDDITANELQIPSYDGALVPLSIIHRKDMKLDATNPVFLRAYGAYGISSSPVFSPPLLAWLDRGGIYCIAHVRGGGELGQDWYKAGYKLTKPNTWRDLIACSQFLIDHRYTSSSHLAIDGGSAGGITMSRCLTERPDLFGAVCIQVGVCNALRSETSANGPNNIPEFGSTKTLEGFEDLYAMDGTVHVRPNTPYPATLLTTGINDPRVDSWEPAKMAAHLQAATSSHNPILLRVDYQAGHGVGSSKQQRINELADMYAFCLHAFQQNTAATPTSAPAP